MADRGRLQTRGEQNQISLCTCTATALALPLPPHRALRRERTRWGKTSSEQQKKEENSSSKLVRVYIAAWLHGIYVTADRACVFLSPIPPSLPFVTFNGKMCGQFPFCLHCFRQIKGLAKKSLVSYFIQNTHTCIYLYIYVNLFRISSSHALYSSTLLSVMAAGADLRRSLPLWSAQGDEAISDLAWETFTRKLNWQKPFLSSAFYFLSDRFIHFSFSVALLKPHAPFMTVLIFYQFREL